MFLNLQILKRMLRMSKKKGMIQDHMIMKVLAYTGIRVGELQYFTLENIEQAKQYITIYNKGKERDVPLRSDLRRELLKYAKVKNRIRDIVSWKKRPSKMLTEKTIREHIKKICGMCRELTWIKRILMHLDTCSLFNGSMKMETALYQN